MTPVPVAISENTLSWFAGADPVLADISLLFGRAGHGGGDGGRNG